MDVVLASALKTIAANERLIERKQSETTKLRQFVARAYPEHFALDDGLSKELTDALSRADEFVNVKAVAKFRTSPVATAREWMKEQRRKYAIGLKDEKGILWIKISDLIILSSKRRRSRKPRAVARRS
jgi:hypothetical protein